MFPRVWWASRALSGFHLPWSGCLDRSSSFAALSREKLPKSAIPIPKKFSSGMCFVLSPPPGWCHGEGFHCKGRQGWWSWRAMHAGQSGWSAVEEKIFQSYSSFSSFSRQVISCRKMFFNLILVFQGSYRGSWEVVDEGSRQTEIPLSVMQCVLGEEDSEEGPHK